MKDKAWAPDEKYVNKQLNSKMKEHQQGIVSMSSRLSDKCSNKFRCWAQLNVLEKKPVKLSLALRRFLTIGYACNVQGREAL